MISAIIIGLIAGAIAKLLMPGKDPGGWIITAVLGMAGAATANFIGVRTGIYAENEPAGLIAAVLGAMLLLWIYRMVVARRGVV